MYLIDTNVISELRKQARADPGVRKFFQVAAEQKARLYISAITIGELRRGVELIRYRGDLPQASLLENWLQTILDSYADHILDFTEVEAQVWGCLCAPQPQNAIDKQIAAIALTRDLILVTRNVSDFADTGVSLVNPFEVADTV
ncbi:type II toxin-antitoxin system VapC family toxin [Acaryochloris sp. 'Moss Beach']|uniref:type II toxin-antitoxin system VapC family toxin n=1 Tax=Acaryochloris sp. 'Moss Beach' TaxID=2740837 RepID=UPI001F1C2B91|nr:type II toxin-antitoxin system VapC family toxin [Acaryochloris sp. 'Moss Beach']UJB70215.1 type II toxin-antitoxin system VapC family toxin [Acaryochloris sp. 'Moss Beach']